jgi:hypothetical protein
LGEGLAPLDLFDVKGSFLNEGSGRLILFFGLTCEVAFDSINKKYLVLAVDDTTGDGCFGGCS